MDNSLGVRKGTWTKEEDIILKNYITKYGVGKWHQVPLQSGLKRCRKSCRLRWLNYLRPDINRGCFTNDELDLIFRLHKLLGNKWSLIAGRLPGRTANDVKNFWNTYVEKKLILGEERTTDTIVNNNDNNNNNNYQEIKYSPNSNIIRPRPLTLKNTLHINRPEEIPRKGEITEYKQNQNANVASASQEKPNDTVEWWSKLLELANNDESGNVRSLEHGKQTGMPSTGEMSSFSFEEFDLEELLNFEEH